MVEIITFLGHPLQTERENASIFFDDCTLVNKNTDFPTCYGYMEGECSDCEALKYYPEVKTALTKLSIEGIL